MPATPTFNYDQPAERGRYSALATCSTQGCDARVERLGFASRWETQRFIESGQWDEAREVFGLDNRTGRPRSVCRRCNAERARARRERLQAQGVPTAPRRGNYVPQADRRFGVEIELIYPRGRSRADIERALQDAGLVVDGIYQRRSNAWSVKTDGSLRGNGFEVTSPVLQGIDGHEQVAKACRALQAVGGKADRTCGLHVHHEIRDLDVEGVRRFVRTYHANTAVIDGALAPSRRAANMPTYCRAWDQRNVDAMTECRTIETIASRAQGTRYRTVNLQSYARYGTVEIRHHQGSVNATKISEWVKFGQALIDSSARGAVAAQRDMLSLCRAVGANDDTACYMIGRTAMLAAAAGGE